MTRAARNVLADCRLAHQLLENEIDEKLWRVHWVGALSLIRAVGHVLEKVDGSERTCRLISDRLFRLWCENSKKEHQIFRQFIKHERDLMLKDHSTSVNLASSVSISISDSEELFGLDQNIFRPIESGPYAGEDARDVYEMAIEWWRNQLDLVDQLVSIEKTK